MGACADATPESIISTEARARNRKLKRFDVQRDFKGDSREKSQNMNHLHI
jgi:hypothetical protein